MAGCHLHGQLPNGSQESYPELNYKPGAKWIKSLTQDRLNQFLGGHFSSVNLSSVLFAQRLDDVSHISMEVWSAPGLTKPSFSEAICQTFKPARKGHSIGPSWTNHWFKVHLNIPSSWAGKYERVQLEFDPGCEAMVFSPDGDPLHGLTGGFGGDRRVEHIVPPHAVCAGRYDIVIEVSCNGMFGVPTGGDTIAPPDPNRFFSIASADLVVPRQEAWRLMWDFEALKQIVRTLPGNSPLQHKALVTANEIMNAFNSGDESSITKARKVAEAIFGEAWEAKGAGIYNIPPAGDNEVETIDIWGIGHCHIDTAWLWPYRVTQQKVARSWSTQIDLMDRFPEHRFAASSAQQYAWLEKLYPTLFARLQEQVKNGNFHPVGGAWIENDANMPSGEALVRQALYGQRYFESRFGERCETAWLPDSFGLTGAYPQIFRNAGMKYFFTQKLSWNNVNVFPHSTFNWVGIDGTQVLCHMTPVETYTAQATVEDVRKGVINHKNLESNRSALLVFGNGDGGGGPLPKMLENLRRIRAAANQSRDIPVVDMGHSVDDFFRAVERESTAGKTLPAWHGELYLEFHRGTYTSHGSIKRGNRKSEILLRDVEIISTLASLLGIKSYQYPKRHIDEMWEKVLLNQFLPGSAIGMVYADAEVLYAEVREMGKKLIEDALGSLFPHPSVGLSGPSIFATPKADAFGTVQQQGGTLLAVNTTPFPRRDVVSVPLNIAGAKQYTWINSMLQNQVVQTTPAGSTPSGYALLQADAGFAFASPRGLLADCNAASVHTTNNRDFILRNAAVELTLHDGRISSLIDRQLGRELLAAGETGGMVIFEDRPGYWDAWDVEIYHLEKRSPLQFSNIRVVANGPLRAAVAADLKFGQSEATVTISLDAVSATLALQSRPYFRFDARVSWYERHQILKFELPLDIHNDQAIYETQFGFVQRPTHKNTTWDAAKFEVCGHKYVDLSEYGYGVGILSESKYGFSCTGNVLRISLLRGATAPDAEQDQGTHEFSWAVLPHIGHFLQSDVPQAAYLFNSPLHVRFASDAILNIPALNCQDPIFSVQGAPNVILETIKRGEDDDDFALQPQFAAYTTPLSCVATNLSSKRGTGGCTVVFRLYEAFGGHARAFLRIAGAGFAERGLRVARAHIANLLEDRLEEESLNRHACNAEGACSCTERHHVGIQLDFRGFEVKTVVLELTPLDSELETLPGKERELSEGGSEEYEYVHGCRLDSA